MRVKAKVDGEIQWPLEQGGFGGVVFKAGEKLTIPERYFDPARFVSLEPRKLEPEKDEGKKD